MDFTFTEEQRMMAAAVRELLADVCSPAVLRAVAEGRDASGAARWARYCELGLPGLLAPGIRRRARALETSISC